MRRVLYLKFFKLSIYFYCWVLQIFLRFPNPGFHRIDVSLDLFSVLQLLFHHLPVTPHFLLHASETVQGESRSELEVKGTPSSQHCIIQNRHFFFFIGKISDLFASKYTSPKLSANFQQDLRLVQVYWMWMIFPWKNWELTHSIATTSQLIFYVK